jgi:tetratricopeptide (TPR) repeat protein
MELYSLEGDIELRSGRSQRAIQSEKKALAYVDSYEPYLSLAEACERVGDWNCANKAYGSYLRREGEILRDDVGSDWVIAHYSLAKSYLKSGDIKSAAISYQQFMKLFSSADSDLPVVTQAKREYALIERIRSSD